MAYRENPKTAGSGIVCVIPHTGRCPNNCEDCFFQGGRSYLEPLEDHLPNMCPVEAATGRVVRVNDGHDSSVNRVGVMKACQQYPWRFYNTAIPHQLADFDAPVVLTVNPGLKTDKEAVLLDTAPPNLMFVRFRTNLWNLALADTVVEHYAQLERPIVLTFMAYFDTPIPAQYAWGYVFRKRTLNSYWAITTAAWEQATQRWKHNKWVYSCGKIEGERGTAACRHCGNCLREFFATHERMRA